MGRRILLVFALAAMSIAARAGEPADGSLGNLNWGPVALERRPCVQTKAEPSDDLKALAQNVGKRAQGELNDTILAVETISVSDHSFFHSKEYKAGEQVARDLRKVLHFSLCARFGEPPLTEQCQGKALKAIDEWVSTYKPSGQPIDESRLITLIQSIDLMQDRMSEATREKSPKWLKTLISRSDAFFKSQMQGHDPADKNWNTWRVAIRAVAAQVLNDKSEIAKSSELVHKQARDNFVRDGQGKTNGTSLDFVARDALHYHVYDMQAWLTIANLTPCSLNPDDKVTVQAGLEFLKPYYLGQKQHVEFVNTKIEEDRARGKAGDETYQPHVWKPGEGGDAWLNRLLVRWGRPGFPAIRSWTKTYVDPEYDAADKFLAKLWGEPETSP